MVQSFRHHFPFARLLHPRPAAYCMMTVLEGLSISDGGKLFHQQRPVLKKADANFYWAQSPL